MRNKITAALLSAALVTSLSSPAFAGDRDKARVAIAGAKAKLDLNEKTGITGEAASVQARARAALERAEREFRDSNEHNARTAADEASALADLAATTQQKQLADAHTAQLEPR